MYMWLYTSVSPQRWSSPAAQWQQIHLKYRRFRRCRFDSWVRKIPWRRKTQLTPAFFSWKFHKTRSLVGHSSWDHKVMLRHDWAQELYFKKLIVFRCINIYRYIYVIYIYIYNLLTLDKTLIKNQNGMLEFKSARLKMQNTFNEFTIKLDMP